MDNNFEKIIPWNGSNDTGRDVRLKLERNFAKIAASLLELNDKNIENDEWIDLILQELKKFLRKDQPDTAAEIITFLKGILMGKFVSGMLGGSGAAITVDKYGKTTYEGDRMILREELIVPKITFNCIDVISGDKANTFAFGTIKSVDKETQTAELDLLDDQTGTLDPADICRGVFHNLEGGNRTEEAYDDNGYLNYAGFSTAYFTPTEIIESKPGKMTFKYSIQAGTTVHPMKGMNFFAYGNFRDKSRQSITYENRYYTRRLKNVNTWVINPDKHIAMQDGLLEGLRIGGMVMHGYGTYMENCYFTGVQIQFTPQQKEELTGQDAYSVNLSTYESIVVVDDENNILGGYAEEKYVTSGDSYVTSEGKYVTAMLSRIKTRIQAFRGSRELYYSDTYHEDAYLVNLNPVGCKATIDNGVVSVDEITDFAGAYVDISVNCEGNTVFEKQFTVKTVKNGTSAISVDLDNQMANVATDADGNAVNGLPIVSKANMWYGNQSIPVDKIDITFPQGVTGSVDKDTITITGVTKDAPLTLDIPLTVFGSYGGNQYHRGSKLSVNKIKPGANGESSAIYQLLPSASSVKVDEEGHYTDSVLTCSVTLTEAKETKTLEALPEGIVIRYELDGGSESVYTYGTSIPLDGKKKSVKFSLYQNQRLIDVEDVPVIMDGSKGKDAPYPEYRYRYAYDRPDTPTGFSPIGWSLSPDCPDIPYDHSGDCTSDGTIYSTPVPSNYNKTYVQRVSFTTPVDNCTVNLEIILQSAYGNRKGIITQMDTPYSDYSSNPLLVPFWTGSRDVKSLVSMPVGKAGSHYIEIVYTTGTIIEVTDCLKYRIVNPGICWMTTATLDPLFLSCPAWSTPVKFVKDSPGTETIYILSAYETLIPLPSGDEFTDKYIGKCQSYDPQKQYNQGDIVFEGSTHHVCKIACKNMAPSNDGYWMRAHWWGEIQMSPYYTYPYVYSCKRRFDNGRWSDYGEYALVASYANTATIIPSVSQISRTMTGSYMPESFTATFTESNGKNIYGFMGAWGSNDNVNFAAVEVVRETSRLTVDVAANPYKHYVIRTYERQPSSIVWTTPYLKSVTVNVVSDGSNGPMPVYCDFYTPGTEYTYTDTTRDIINYEIDGGTFTFQVKVHGAKVTVPPTSSMGDGNWEPANKMKFVAMDTALIDGADIAGFVYKNLKMISRKGILDGLEIDIKNVPDNRFNDFHPHTSINGTTGAVEFGKATIRGGVSEPFEEYSSFEELKAGRSMSWYLRDPSVLDGIVIGPLEGKKNGCSLRIYNASQRTCEFSMYIIYHGIRNIQLPANGYLTADGIINPASGYVNWMLTVPNKLNSATGTFIINSFTT